MEPHMPELQKTPEQRKEPSKSRFQIVKLEERIAPRRSCYYYCGGNNGWGRGGSGGHVGHGKWN